jgi:hypothetical protein
MNDEIEKQLYDSGTKDEIPIMLVDLVAERQEIRRVPAKDIIVYDFDMFKAKLLVIVDGAVYLAQSDYIAEDGSPYMIERKKFRNIVFTKAKNVLTILG